MVTTLEDRINKQKKSLLIQSLFILVAGNILGLQFFRVAKDYEVVNINNIQEVLIKVQELMQTKFFFISCFFTFYFS